ncbi:MAG: OmpA family protein [Myxococcales bacterium]|nr:OmpA family protein [Myxococcales bacterium]
MRRLVAVLVVAALAGTAVADPSPAAGVDAALFRPSIDGSGVLSLEGARLPVKHDLSWKMWLGYGKGPFNVAVPGIGADSDDAVLDYLVTLDMAFGLTVSKKVAIGLAAAVYRTDTGPGYGQRGRFQGESATPSTGMISLRPLTNIDQSGGYEPQGLSGPLDVRASGKYQFLEGSNLAAAAMVTVVLPFGEDEMFLGDRNLVFEPRVTADYRFDRLHATKLVANLGARIRQRTVLEAYDKATLPVTQTPEQAAQVVLDVGSELTAGVGANVELSPAVVASVEVVGFVPLPSAVTYGSCTRVDGRRCSTLESTDYFAGGKAGDLAAYAAAGLNYRVNPHVTATAAATYGITGARGDDFSVLVGAVWSPQPASEARVGRGDKDGDGIPDVSDACVEDSEDNDGFQDDDGCPDLDNDGDGVVDANDQCTEEPEDRDGYQDDDGCPERDNDGDGIQDIADRCPDDAEDIDGFDDGDGCSDEDNDGDGFADKNDKCPDDPETVNGVDDDDGCPDVRTQTGPVEAVDRIDLRGNKIEFSGTALTPASKVILGQVAAIVRDKKLSVRIEVHVALGTKSKNARTIASQKKKDKDQAGKRGQAVLEYLVTQGVPVAQIQAVGLGSDRPLGASLPTDAINDRVDFIKSQQRTP